MAGSAVLTVTLLAAVAGCGIRATSVPVDAGPAPSRESCALPDATASAPAGAAADRRTVQINLVCSSQVAAVTRIVPSLRENRLDTARRLIAELQRQPYATEVKARFSTDVPGDLGVGGPLKGDPEQTLRLTQRVADLPPFGLGQIVCTLAGTAAGETNGGVVLGGPDDDPPRRYTCTGELRTQPSPAESAGTAVK